MTQADNHTPLTAEDYEALAKRWDDAAEMRRSVSNNEGPAFDAERHARAFRQAAARLCAHGDVLDALRPFAAIADECDQEPKKLRSVINVPAIIDMCRAARKALALAEGGGK